MLKDNIVIPNLLKLEYLRYKEKGIYLYIIEYNIYLYFLSFKLNYKGKHIIFALAIWFVYFYGITAVGKNIWR